MRHLMRSLTALVLLLITVGNITAQDPCDEIVIGSVQYSAVHPDVLEIMAYSQGNDCVSYPSFILYAPNGDTLAMETVNFFCLGMGFPQTHFLAIQPGVQLPTGTFNASLELFTGFGETLVCTWDLNDLDPCPAESCIEAEIYLTNTGELVPFTAYWWITDDTGDQVDDGWFEMDENMATGFDTTCLAPGNYTLTFTPFSPIDESYVAGITRSWQQSIGTNVAQQQDTTPLDLEFHWYLPCADGTNSIQEAELPGILLQSDHSLLGISALDNEPLGTVNLHTLDGRMVRSLSTRNASTNIPVDDLATGIHIVRIDRGNGEIIIRKAFIH